jgi:hypothetical protein
MDLYSFLIIAFVLLIAAVAVVGGVIELLQQRVVVDVATREIVEIELPGLGSFKSNYPSLGAIALGLLAGVGVFLGTNIERANIPVTATVTVTNPDELNLSDASLFLKIVPQRYRTQLLNTPIDEAFSLVIDVEQGGNYIGIVHGSARDTINRKIYQGVTSGPVRFGNVGGRTTGTYDAILQVRRLEE